MEFRLTYAGRLLAHKGGRSSHIHDVRQMFHPQIKALWAKHPVLNRGHSVVPAIPDPERDWGAQIEEHGRLWQPLATKQNGLVCELDIVMLRDGPLGGLRTDMDNRLKTLFDALRIPPSDSFPEGGIPPNEPLYVLLEDDCLITRVAVTSDTLLEEVGGVPRGEDAVRLMIGVVIRPYDVGNENVVFAG